MSSVSPSPQPALGEARPQAARASLLASLLLEGASLSDKLLLALSGVSSFVYLVTIGWQPYAGSVMIKGLCISPLALLAFRRLKDRDGWWLGTALIFSTLGDVLLGWRGKNLFLYGLLAFLVAHLLYIVLFQRHFLRPLTTTAKQKLRLAMLLAFTGALLAWLLPGLGEMRIPVLIYIVVITLMCTTAILASFSTPWVVTGALLFLLSDALIGITRFKMPIALSGYAIWLTYYVGQYLIAIGFLREKRDGRVKGRPRERMKEEGETGRRGDLYT